MTQAPSYRHGVSVQVIAGGRCGKLIRVDPVKGSLTTVWTCPHLHRTHAAAYECARREQIRRG